MRALRLEEKKITILFGVSIKKIHSDKTINSIVILDKFAFHSLQHLSTLEN